MFNTIRNIRKFLGVGEKAKTLLYGDNVVSKDGNI